MMACAVNRSRIKTIVENQNTVLLSPTGSGKTLAFLLPLLEDLDPDLAEVIGTKSRQNSRYFNELA